MTLFAIGTEPGFGMIRINALGIAFQMAPLAHHRRPGKFVSTLVDMAGVAIDYRVNPHKRKTLLSMLAQNIFMILPIGGRMTALTIETELPAMDIGMAIGAGDAGMGKPQILMATTAFDQSMASHERKTGFIMVELQIGFNLIP
jgi:hypothetical protein